MTDDARAVHTDEPPTDAQDASAGATDAPPQYGVGPFSLREVVIGGIWLVAFVLSFIPVFGGSSLWGLGLTWLLTIGVPTVAVFLLVLRRLSPDGIRRVGSLGIDQFASVAFSVSAAYWLTLVWQQLAVAIAGGPAGPATWLIWVEFILMLGGVVFTVCAPLLPVFGEDFRHRPEAVAHPNARRLRPIVPRPATPRPERPAPAPAASFDQTPPPAASSEQVPPAQQAEDETATTAFAAFDLPEQRGEEDDVVFVSEAAPVTDEDIAAAEATGPAAETDEGSHEQAAAAPQAFWALAPEERDVLDAAGLPIFRIGPTAWALVIEDRGEVFVIRHEDGRIGYLHEVDGVARG